MTHCQDDKVFKRLRRDFESLAEELDYVNTEVVNVSEEESTRQAEKQLRGIMEFLTQ